MILQIQKYDLGVQIMTLDKKNDNRGYVVEIFGEDLLTQKPYDWMIINE